MCDFKRDWQKIGNELGINLNLYVDALGETQVHQIIRHEVLDDDGKINTTLLKEVLSQQLNAEMRIASGEYSRNDFDFVINNIPTVTTPDEALDWLDEYYEGLIPD